MTTRFSDKDPSDVVTVEFDFSQRAASVTAPTINVTVFAGTDPAPDLNVAMLDGSASVLGAKVLQRIKAGLNGVDYAIECVAESGSERHTLDAILPVRERPTADTAVPRYCTEAQFERRFSQRELADLLAAGHSYGQAENDSASMIDGYLATRYTLPLTIVPALITGICADLTRYRLWDQQAPDEVRRRYEDALKQLRDLASGSLSLPPDASGVAPTGGLTFDGYAAERVFTAETLADF